MIDHHMHKCAEIHESGNDIDWIGFLPGTFKVFQVL
jgi:hypothetical protein